MGVTDTPVTKSDFGTMGREAKERLANNKDFQVLIQAENSERGVGKTVLAIQLCRYIDPQWSAEEKSFINVQKYLNAHVRKPEGSALLLDEIELGASKYRSSSHENEKLRQGWATLRTRRIATVATAPSTNMVDGDLMELANYWVLVRERGLAQPYRINVNDFTGKVSRDPLPGDEHIQFRDLPKNDPDKAYLDEIKDDTVTGESNEYVTEAEVKERVSEAREEERKDVRDEFITSLYHCSDWSYATIAELDFLDVSADMVGKIVRNNS